MATTDTAKYYRLRRMCVPTGRGRCKVSKEVQQAYKEGGEARQRLMDQFEACDFDKDGLGDIWFYRGIHKTC